MFDHEMEINSKKASIVEFSEFSAIFSIFRALNSIIADIELGKSID